MTVYISGAITGVDEHVYRQNFSRRKKILKDMGHVPVDPCGIGDRLRREMLLEEGREPTHEEYMNACLPHLLKCDGISMLGDWEQSRGARVERDVAIATGKIFVEVRRCIYDGD